MNTGSFEDKVSVLREVMEEEILKGVPVDFIILAYVNTYGLKITDAVLEGSSIGGTYDYTDNAGSDIIDVGNSSLN